MTAELDLERFVHAQEADYQIALAEIRRGRKRSHWMWYIFPQIDRLGHSAMSRRYAIRSLEEAHAYLDHPLLGHRLRECVSALHDLTGTTAQQVFGTVDAAKLRSSLTLFLAVANEPLFGAALERWFGGNRDARTVALLGDLDAP